MLIIWLYLVKYLTVINRKMFKTSSRGSLEACFPWKCWNFKALKCDYQGPRYKIEYKRKGDLISSFFYNCFWSLETVQTKKVQNIPLSVTNNVSCSYHVTISKIKVIQCKTHRSCQSTEAQSISNLCVSRSPGVTINFHAFKDEVNGNWHRIRTQIPKESENLKAICIHNE